VADEGSATAARPAAVSSLRAVILAGEHYRQAISDHVGLGLTETHAISHLVVHGDRGQHELAHDLGLSSGAATALVDRLERQEIAERYPHPTDRRRTLVRLTAKGHAVVQQSDTRLGAALQDVPAADLERVSGLLQAIARRLDEQSQQLSASPSP
jgi:DNA-binding MarR family transcriptional regulator